MAIYVCARSWMALLALSARLIEQGKEIRISAAAFWLVEVPRWQALAVWRSQPPALEINRAPAASANNNAALNPANN